MNENILQADKVVSYVKKTSTGRAVIMIDTRQTKEVKEGDKIVISKSPFSGSIDILTAAFATATPPALPLCTFRIRPPRGHPRSCGEVCIRCAERVDLARPQRQDDPARSELLAQDDAVALRGNKFRSAAHMLPGLALMAFADTVVDEPRASVSGYYYLVPSSPGAALGIGTVDHGRAHFEARYGYEDVRTGSAFLGVHFDVPLFRALELTVTPIAGAVFGRTRGVAPGLEVEARLGKLELTTESEYVVDARDPRASFFYSWSELVVRPLKPLRAGVVLQRTRVFRDSATLEPGAVVALTAGAWTTKAYAFVPYDPARFYAFAVEAQF